MRKWLARPSVGQATNWIVERDGRVMVLLQNEADAQFIADACNAAELQLGERDLLTTSFMERRENGEPIAVVLNFYCPEHEQDYSLVLKHLEGYVLTTDDLGRAMEMFNGLLKCGCRTVMPSIAEVQERVGWNA